MTDTSHLLKSFDASLDGLLNDFKAMGELTAQNCSLAIKAYLSTDAALALEVVNRDLVIDDAFEKVRSDCFDALLRYQPVAKDLRLIIGIEHAVGDLERAGDHAKNIAKRVISNAAPAMADADARAIDDMAAIVTKAIETSVAAMTARAAEDARAVIVADEHIDARNDAIFDAAIVALSQAPADANTQVQRLFVAKALERIGDHATNIAEEVLFLTRGIAPGATRTHPDVA
jgi:phosphate transport system protein